MMIHIAFYSSFFSFEFEDFFSNSYFYQMILFSPYMIYTWQIYENAVVAIWWIPLRKHTVKKILQIKFSILSHGHILYIQNNHGTIKNNSQDISLIMSNNIYPLIHEIMWDANLSSCVKVLHFYLSVKCNKFCNFIIYWPNENRFSFWAF